LSLRPVFGRAYADTSAWILTHCFFYDFLMTSKLFVIDGANVLKKDLVLRANFLEPLENVVAMTYKLALQ
jgi:hypothetical protein